MRLTFLGTGSAMPTGERHQTGFLLEAGGDRLLVDCGSGVLHRLAETEAGYEGVDTLLLTHHHIDHVSDFMPLLKAKWLAGSTSLVVAGPPGTRDLVDGLLSVHAYMQDRLDLSIREISPGSFDLAGFDIEAMETRHSMTCHAYRLGAAGTDGDDAEVTISGDTEAFAELATFADGSEVLVHDCSFPDEVDVSNHPTPALLGETLAGHEFGTVYLTHLYPHTRGKRREMLDSLAASYDGEIRFARDGLMVET
jgi:ribonuclease BN (tRNA processing enzyme)